MLSVSAVLATVLGGTGCGDTPQLAAPDPVDSFWELRLNHRAATLSTIAPHNTIQITATPLRPDGTALSGGSPIEYSTTSEAVRIDTTGLITALSTTSGIDIEASMQVGNLTLVDTLHLIITNDVPESVKSFSLQRPPTLQALARRCQPDASPTASRLIVAAIDANDIPISAAAYFWSSDVSVLKVDRTTGRVEFPCKEGIAEATVYASSTIYGVTYTDSLRFTIRPPLLGAISIWAEPKPRSLVDVFPITKMGFTPNTLTVDQGGIVAWYIEESWIPPGAYPVEPFKTFGLSLPPAIDIVFDTPASIQATMDSVPLFGNMLPPSGQGGNIPAFTADTTYTWFSNEVLVSKYRVRKFSQPGTYHYRSRFGTSGTIIVRDSTQ